MRERSTCSTWFQGITFLSRTILQHMQPAAQFATQPVSILVLEG